jgi:hypothetical protein
MCISNLSDIKKSIQRDIKEIELQRRLELINGLGEPLSRYDIIDRREMSPELVNEFRMALDPKSDSIRSVIPSSEKPRIRVGPSQYEIRYNYDLRADVNGPKILPDGRTRDFCVHLIDASKLYTREEIDRMNNGFGLDVFEFSGGYWTQPDGSVSPKCRHSWYQNIVIRK